MMPECNGGTCQYLLAGVGPFFSFIGNTAAYVITMILSTCAEISLCGMVLTDLFFPNLDYRWVSVSLLVIFMIVNYFGINLFAKIQDVIVILLLGSMIILGFIGAFKLGTGTPVVYQHLSFRSIGGMQGILNYAAIAFWLFIGVEYVIPVANDMKNPKRDVLLSMTLALLALFIIQSVLGWGFTNYVSLEVLTDTDLPHMVYVTSLLGKPGAYWMGIITMLASISTLNTIYASSSRIIQGMGEMRMIPSVFAKTNQYNVSVAGLLVMGVGIGSLVVANAAVSNSVNFFILAASCFWLLSYILIHISVLVLRVRYPDAPRRKALKLAGIPQILGIIGNVYMIIHIDSGSNRLKIYMIFGIILAVMLVYALIWFFGVQHVNPFKTVPMSLINEDGDLRDTEKYRTMEKEAKAAAKAVSSNE